MSGKKILRADLNGNWVEGVTFDAKIPRNEAEAMIERQLLPGTGGGDGGLRADKFSNWHYGRIELRELLDAIYGENPYPTPD